MQYLNTKTNCGKPIGSKGINTVSSHIIERFLLSSNLIFKCSTLVPGLCDESQARDSIYSAGYTQPECATNSIRFKLGYLHSGFNYAPTLICKSVRVWVITQTLPRFRCKRQFELYINLFDLPEPRFCWVMRSEQLRSI